ncbi:MerR family transcriptional regulator [Streptomyces sp. NPDC050560]|uniref:MerR family transcriptional regulator n=1 Tax=Streptomyces sp. NPDC050560 TaxID=3365630 RepID=UPI0037A69CD3
MREDTLSIGELSHRTGVPVRTVRYYCDEGLVEAVRSTGGHRRFGTDAVERLTLLRRLRTLGLGLAAIRTVLAGKCSLADAAAAERARVDVELAALAWRRASLGAVELAAPEERAARLELLAAAAEGGAARRTLETFWRRLALPALPEDGAAMVVAATVPEPPGDPTPEQVVAYAALVAVVGDPRLRQELGPRLRASAETAAYQHALLTGGFTEACEDALARIRAGERPGPGPRADAFAAVHAAARGTSDTPAFRRALLRTARADLHPAMRRYWSLVGDLTGEDVTVGEAHSWLLDSLARSVA